jgi:hypothetical protein
MREFLYLIDLFRVRQLHSNRISDILIMPFTLSNELGGVHSRASKKTKRTGLP